MAVVPMGGSLVLMQGFARQKAQARDPRKKARMIHWRRYVVPSETFESLQARIALAEAAKMARGKSFEEVIATIVTECSNKDYGGKAKRERLREARYRQADANIARMRAKLEEMRRFAGRGYAAAYVGLPTPAE